MILQCREKLDLCARTGLTTLTISPYGVDVLNYNKIIAHRTFYVREDVYCTHKGYIEISSTTGRVIINYPQLTSEGLQREL